MRIEAVTGPRGAGKTSALVGVARRLADEGWRVGGVLQLARLAEGRRAGYDLLCLGPGELSVDQIGGVLSDSEHPARLPLVRPAPGGRGFRFEEALWPRAAAALRAARATADLVLVDELGWLEAEGGGHLPALLSPREPDFAHLWLLGVRLDRLDEIEARLGGFARCWRLPDEGAALAAQAWQGRGDGRAEQS